MDRSETTLGDSSLEDGWLSWRRWEKYCDIQHRMLKMLNELLNVDNPVGVRFMRVRRHPLKHFPNLTFDTYPLHPLTTARGRSNYTSDSRSHHRLHTRNRRRRHPPRQPKLTRQFLHLGKGSQERPRAHHDGSLRRRAPPILHRYDIGYSGHTAMPLRSGSLVETK